MTRSWLVILLFSLSFSGLSVAKSWKSFSMLELSWKVFPLSSPEVSDLDIPESSGNFRSQSRRVSLIDPDDDYVASNDDSTVTASTSSLTSTATMASTTAATDDTAIDSSNDSDATDAPVDIKDNTKTAANTKPKKNITKSSHPPLIENATSTVAQSINITEVKLPFTNNTANSTSFASNSTSTNSSEPFFQPMPPSLNFKDDDTIADKYDTTTPLNPVVDDISEFWEPIMGNTTIKWEEPPPPPAWPVEVIVVFLLAATSLIAATCYKQHQKRKVYTRLPT